MTSAAFADDIEVGGVDVHARAFQAVVERQRLVNLAGDVQPDVAVDASVIGIEVVGVPFERCAGSALLVIGAVVDLDRENVLLVAEVDAGR